jgi:hypothetical protein
MDKPITKTLEERVDESLVFFFQGVEGFQKFGEALVDILDNDPDTAAEIYEARSRGLINRNALAMFERIGRRQLHPNLALLSGAGYERLRKMPFSVQEKYLNEPVEVLVRGENGKIDKVLVAVTDLTREQASQVFDRDTVRSLPGQRAWIENERARINAQSQPLAKVPYTIVGNRVIFERCELTKRELLRIMMALEQR